MESSESSLPTPVSDLWFSDGNIVIKTGNRLFKVHRGVLAYHSTFFADLQSLPPSEDQELFEGCPVVEMPDDADAIEYFLRAIINPDFFLPPPASSQYPIVAGILRIAHKYNSPVFKQRALRHLSARMSISRKDYIHRASYSTSLFVSNNFAKDALVAYEIDSAVLLQEVGGTWCLPIVFMSFSRHRAGIIMEGVDFNSEHYEFTPDQKVQLMKGKERLTNAEIPRRLVAMATTATNPECKLAQCVLGCRQLLDLFLLTATDPTPWVTDTFESRVTNSFCQRCNAKIKGEYTRMQIEIWELLPEIFGFPPWADLKKAKKEALGYVYEYSPAPS
ncbi:hypothetical protein DL96DRAFT_1282792 [Flagelloscypha sp. PMI_526]|nr:hypothetical protein DL96DRAFT_1282792 [Flagelloscypha sp. PMI_526]